MTKRIAEKYDETKIYFKPEKLCKKENKVVDRMLLKISWSNNNSWLDSGSL